MKSSFRYVYQFKVVLKLEETAPQIWRRLQVPEDYTFWDFHVALQNAMGWTDSHLHQFETVNTKTKKEEIIGIPEEFYGGIVDEQKTLPGWTLYLRDYFSEDNRTMLYLYDFGDDWKHRIEYERILFKKTKQKYPVCIGGDRACPPEDCGGSFGYERLLEILKNPRDEEYKETRTWAGRNFNPEKFEAAKVRFENPNLRWAQTWGSPDA